MTADLEAFLRAAWPDWDTFTSHMQDVLRAAVEHGLAATPLYKAGAEAMKAQAVTLVRRHATAPDGLIYAENADAVIRGYNMAGERILARVEALPIPGAEPPDELRLRGRAARGDRGQ